MEHLEGMNWQILHELIIAETHRILADTSVYGSTATKQWWLDELERMNKLAVENAMKQA